MDYIRPASLADLDGQSTTALTSLSVHVCYVHPPIGIHFIND